MKLVLAVLMLVITSPSYADELLSTSLFSVNAKTLDLPPNLSFQSNTLRVLDSSWFATLFAKSNCAYLLEETTVDVPFELKSSGPRSIQVTVKGKPLRLFDSANASYVPLFYQGTTPVHPYFLLKLKDWVSLHVIIHRNGDKKNMKVSVVHRGKDGKGDSLHPVFEAEGF
jgi:hypothetical protein